MGARRTRSNAAMPPHVVVYRSVLKEPAWKNLSFGARCLYITLKSFYNGQNNGEIFLAARKAADELGANKASVCRWFDELQRHGFIVMTEANYLGLDGVAQAARWRLTELGCRGNQPTREFKDWQPKNPYPVRKMQRGRPQNADKAS